MKRFLVLPVLLVCVGALLVAGCSVPVQQSPAGHSQTQPSSSPETAGDALFAQGEDAYNSSNYYAAAEYFALAKENYSAAGDAASFLRSRDMLFRSRGVIENFPYNRSAMEAVVAETFPDVPAAERAAWLDREKNGTLNSDGEVWYFDETLNNVLFHNTAMMREMNAQANHTPMYDELIPLITAQWKDGTGPYGEPVSYKGVAELSIPRGDLPANGTLKLWVPVPIESGSQTNVTIVSVEPARYVKSSTGTGADLGLVYLEVPLEEVTGPFLNVSARFRFVQHEQRFRIDPAHVQPCDTSDPEYLKYTAPSGNIAITPGIQAKAREIVGNETNPYLMAEKVYWDVVSTHPYSHAPHIYLDFTGTPESVYVISTGIGDCASQSAYYVALLRSLGIPARATGGYQMIEGHADTHFWTGFYLKGHGWIPADVTAAEGENGRTTRHPERCSDSRRITSAASIPSATSSRTIWISRSLRTWGTQQPRSPGGCRSPN